MDIIVMIWAMNKTFFFYKNILFNQQNV